MRIIFKDTSDEIQYDYWDALPDKTMTLRIKGESAYKINIQALYFYGLYKQSIYNSYKEKPDLAKDIRERKKEYQERSGSELSKNSNYQDPIYHYSVAASLGAMKEWIESNGKMKCYIAYQNKNGHRSKIGFIHFIEQTVNDKPIVYIAQAGVENRGKSVGRHLMECVLAHYPPQTEFYILTRVFNSEAKNLYQARLKFDPIEEWEIKQLGYDDRYCGFKHTTSAEEVNSIKNNQIIFSALPQNYAMKCGIFANKKLETTSSEEKYTLLQRR